MKATLKRLISSSTTTIVLLLVYGAGLAIATFIEKYHGTPEPQYRFTPKARKESA